MTRGQLILRLQIMVFGLLLLSATSASAEMPLESAWIFINSVGVNTHFTYTDTPYYTDYPNVKAKLLSLGVRRIRDTATNDSTSYANLNDLIASGLAYDAVAPYQAWPSGDINYFLSSVSPIAECEFTNEPDNMPGGPISVWGPLVTAQLSGLYSLCHSSGLGVYGPSIATPQDMQSYGSVAPYVDFSSIHPYYWPGLPPENSGNGLSQYMVAAYTYAAPGKPVVATETGYCIYGAMSGGAPATDLAGQATYLPRTFFYHANSGVGVTYWYQLLSLASEGCKSGLLDVDETPFAAYYAMSNMLALLRDANASFTLTNFVYTPSDSSSWNSFEHTLLQKSDGTYWMAVWQPVSVWDTTTHTDIPVSPVPIGLTWSGPSGYEVYTFNSDGTVTDGGPQAGSSVTLSVGATVTLLRIGQPD